VFAKGVVREVSDVVVTKRVAKAILERILQGEEPRERLKLLEPRVPTKDEPLPPHPPCATEHTSDALDRRRAFFRERGLCLDQLAGEGPEVPAEELEGNIEGLVGFARVPVGVVGPLRVNGSEAHGDFYVPMATTEGALVASYQRGAEVISRAGGATTLCITEAVSRAPCFVFGNMREAAEFLAYAIPRYDSLQSAVDETSGHCRLDDVRTVMFGKEVFLVFEYTTGDAAGQNMVTIATDAACRRLLEDAPVQPRRWYVEGNLSGDKKATMLSFVYARGRKVISEVTVPRRVVQRFLHVDPEEVARYWKTSILGGVQSGSIGVQGHFANALTAIFMACGQDVACVSEAAIGMNHMEATEEGDLYAFVALPNLIVGTVGGGTHLPTARECLEMMDCHGTGKARKFAEVCCAAALAGEISIAAAMAAGQFTDAHAIYGRKGSASNDEGDH